MIKKIFKNNWFYFLMFLIIIVSDSIVDEVAFHRLRESGFWSITKNQFDAFHLFKLIKYLAILVSFIKITWQIATTFRELSFMLFIYVAIIMYLIHEIILHLI